MMTKSIALFMLTRPIDCLFESRLRVARAQRAGHWRPTCAILIKSDHSHNRPRHTERYDCPKHSMNETPTVRPKALRVFLFDEAEIEAA
jgi:hypothetical protein